MLDKKQKVVILGAGPAGLTAAYELLSRSNHYEIIILEADKQVGGISKTVNYKGNRIDIGGHRFFSKSDRVMRWWLNMMPLSAEIDPAISIQYHGKTKNFTASHEQNPPTDGVMLLRNRLSRIYFLRKFFDYPVSLNITTIKNLGMWRICKILLSYLKYRFKPIQPEVSLEDFFMNRFGKELYLTFFKDYTEKVWGFSCASISKDWGAQRIKGLSISKTLMHALKKMAGGEKNISQKNTETSLIERFLYPKFGPGQMWETVALQVEKMGGIVQYNTTVHTVEIENNRVMGIKAFNTSKNCDVSYPCDLVFSTLAIKDLLLSANNAVPAEISKIASALPYRDFITVGLLCTALEIKDKNNQRIKDNWIYIQERDVKIGRLQIFNNWSEFMVEDENKTWIGLEYFCNEGDELWNKSDLEFIEFAKLELEKIQIIKSENVIDSTIIRMKKTYPAYTGSYKEFESVKKYLLSIENLYCIGRNGMHKYNNSDHSMLTAMESVDYILDNKGSREHIWDINTEENYHESK